ncbi:hypothetical protein OG203_38950 [Nocardia sp. NBC_01499]|uniref:hypothetical protein n=1 Tax=Nocardia sp. NBC_01499 TaxID=2903597 RepID=UPI003868E798
MKLSHHTRAAAVALLLIAAVASSTAAHAEPGERSPAETKELSKQYMNAVGERFCDKFELTPDQVEAYTKAYDRSELVGGEEAELTARNKIRTYARGTKKRDGSQEFAPRYGEEARRSIENDDSSGMSNPFRRLICDYAEASTDYKAKKADYRSDAKKKFKAGFEENDKIVELNYEKGKAMYGVLCEAGVSLKPVEGQKCGADNKNAEDKD